MQCNRHRHYNGSAQESQNDIMIDRLGEKPAPGRLKVVQAFLNTANPKTGRDDLDTPQHLGDWLVEQGLLARKARLSEADLRQATSFRDALYQLLEARHSGQPAPDAIETLNRSARTAQMAISFGTEGRAHIEPLAPIGEFLGS